MDEEPSLLDYLKARLSFGRLEVPEIPALDQERIEPETSQAAPVVAPEPTIGIPAREGLTSRLRLGFPWRALGALIIALAAQASLEPPDRSPTLGIIFYALAAGLAVWAAVKDEWTVAPPREDAGVPMSLRLEHNALLASLPLVILSFIAFGGNRFNGTNLALWGLTLAYVLWAMWLPASTTGLVERIRGWLKSWGNTVIQIRAAPWMALVLILAVVVVGFFRFYDLGGVPGEMVSDHAEKLLDVSDVLNGQTAVFFPRNTGREALQMYLTAAIASLFGTGLSFMSLKIGTAMAGLLTLAYIYLLAREVGNRRVGLLALFLAGVAYWPNVIARMGLRFPLYPLFVAPVLFYLLRGIRTSNRNDMLLAGLALGIGLHGYSTMRIVPFIVVFAVALYLVHRQARGNRWQITWGLAALAFVALVAFLPLLRYMVSNPEMFGYRAFSRLGSIERALPAPVVLVFLSNLWKASIMFFWDNGNIWVHSVPSRPALDLISGALFGMGVILLLYRYVRRRNWVDLFLLLSIPLLMLPSILSLAFPEENPSLNRSGGALVPVFVVAALALEGLLSGIAKRTTSLWQKGVVVIVGLGLLAAAGSQNYDLVFRQYRHQFMAGAWNTSEIGGVIRGFAQSIGSPDNAYVVPTAHWVDTRLVAINAGYPTKDYALWRDQFELTLGDPGAKLFILKPENRDDLQALREMYPQGRAQYHASPLYSGKDFVLYLVPPREDEYEGILEQ
ncbi:MAG: glycosyltransferase family 39 protein [Anaerolineaceae bacterium]|nr:glycosyltransferase family 39 protein [Anaerolineaceae bacterium]